MNEQVPRWMVAGAFALLCGAIFVAWWRYEPQNFSYSASASVRDGARVVANVETSLKSFNPIPLASSHDNEGAPVKSFMWRPDLVRQLFAFEAEVPVFASSVERKRVPIHHVITPESVRAIYMTSWVAGTPSIRTRILELIRETELNSIVIDVKDDTGRIAFPVYDEELVASGAATRRIADLAALIEQLHVDGVYVIGRVSVFQDAYLPTVHPELALASKATGGPWKDRRGLAWLDQRNPEVWDYIARIAREAYAQGFDEVNFDYIRFPSDGDLADIDYWFAATDSLGSSTPKAVDKVEALNEFFRYLDREVRQKGIPTSADLFGQITSERDDMGIGQTIEGAAPYFDTIAPMVYPSHYYSGFLGLRSPASHPYEVVKYALEEGNRKIEILRQVAQATSTTPDSLAPPPGYAELRPWLQDFNLGGVAYSPEMVRAQIQATYDAGIDSWMIWDPSNRYSREAFLSL